MTKIFVTFFLLSNFISRGQTVIDPITIKPDGTVKRFNYNDRMHHSDFVTTGLSLTFWDSSFTKIKTQVTISNGEMNGVFKFFNEKGFLKELSNFKDGIEEGYHYYWNDEGILKRKEKYVHGVLKSTIKYS